MPCALALMHTLTAIGLAAGFTREQRASRGDGTNKARLSKHLMPSHGSCVCNEGYGSPCSEDRIMVALIFPDSSPP